jgi:hypothetical protein
MGYQLAIKGKYLGIYSICFSQFAKAFCKVSYPFRVGYKHRYTLLKQGVSHGAFVATRGF